MFMRLFWFKKRLQLSVYRGITGIEAFMKSKLRALAEQDEAVAMASGIPYTIIRVGLLENTPSGKQGFSFEEVFSFIATFTKQLTTTVTFCYYSSNMICGVLSHLMITCTQYTLILSNFVFLYIL